MDNDRLISGTSISALPHYRTSTCPAAATAAWTASSIELVRLHPEPIADETHRLVLAGAVDGKEHRDVRPKPLDRGDNAFGHDVVRAKAPQKLTSRLPRQRARIAAASLAYEDRRSRL